jgi:hypothetical protein
VSLGVLVRSSMTAKAQTGIHAGLF